MNEHDLHKVLGDYIVNLIKAEVQNVVNSCIKAKDNQIFVAPCCDHTCISSACGSDHGSSTGCRIEPLSGSKLSSDYELDLCESLSDSPSHLSHLKVADKPDSDADTESDEEFTKKSRGSTGPTTNHSTADLTDNCSTVSELPVHVVANSSEEGTASQPRTLDPQYNHKSTPEHPNGDVVETRLYHPTDQDWRAKSIGWATIALHSWKGYARTDCEVQVHRFKDTLKAGGSTFLDGYAKSQRKNSVHAHIKQGGDLKNYERVEIINKICMGVYVCPHHGCIFRERPKLPLRKSKNALPSPAATQCIHHHRTLVLMRCPASMVVIHYLSRRKVQTHHRGIHNHPLPFAIRSSPF